MKDINLKKRLITIGLFVVLLVLTLCSISAAFFIRQTTNQASEAAGMNDLYQGAYDQLLLEDLALHEYMLQPNDVNQQAFLAVYRQSLANLQEIKSVGDADDVAKVQPIIAEQNQLLRATEHLFALANAH